MRLVIFGSRGLSPTLEDIDEELLSWKFSQSGPGPLPVKVTLLLSGAARGADLAGEAWARHHGVPIQQFPVRTETSMSRFQFSVAAKSRNRQMANLCDAAIGWWDGDSPGTANMIAHCVDLGKPVRVVRGVKR